MFKRSYTDVIKAIKKEQAKEQKDFAIFNTSVDFNYNVFVEECDWFIRSKFNDFKDDNIKANEQGEQIKANEQGEQIKVNNNETKMDEEGEIKESKSTTSQYEDHKSLFGYDGILKTVFNIYQPVTPDFLTGCHFGHLIKPHISESFYAHFVGSTNSSVLDGFKYLLKRHRWQWFGTDKNVPIPMPVNYVNGQFRSGDINDCNTVNSIVIQLMERANNLQLVVCDVDPKQVHNLYLSFVFLMNIADRGYGFMRLPNHMKWGKHMMNFFILVCLMFDVKVHTIPWCETVKYYLEVSNPKITRRDKYRSRIMKYVECLKQDDELMLFSKELINSYYTSVNPDDHVEKMVNTEGTLTPSTIMYMNRHLSSVDTTSYWVSFFELANKH